MRPPTNWHQLAAARGFSFDEADLARIAASLDALDAQFRPLIEQIPHEIEPATTLSPDAVTAR